MLYKYNMTLLQLWSAKDLSLIGVMRGHKRGVWCVQFSPIDQVDMIVV